MRHLGSSVRSLPKQFVWVLTVACVLTGFAIAQTTNNTNWVGSWAASPQATPPSSAGPLAVSFATGFSNQTIRDIVHLSVGGSAVRIRLSNAFGNQPVTFNDVHVGIQQSGATVRAGTNRVVTFGGRTSILVPIGAEVYSDPVNLSVGSEQNLAVSIFVSGATGPPTVHATAFQTNYVATGDTSSRDAGAFFTSTATTWYFLDGVDVDASSSIKGTVVALGDSITDGTGSTVNANHRWPNDLFRRFEAANINLGMVDEGIGGNRLLNDSACFGINAQARLDRDVIAQTGVVDVMLLEGINDIGFPGSVGVASLAPFAVCFNPTTLVTPEQLIAAYQQIITRVHAKGLKIFGCTLTPFKGAAYWTQVGENTREAVNDWIKTSGAFDGVVDFAAATEDPNDPLKFAPQFDSGDHLHPSDAGYQAMANAVDLALFRTNP